MTRCSDHEIHLLRHTLGLTRANESYRNRFIAGPGHDDLSALRRLEARGLMVQVRTPAVLGADDIVFVATATGRAIAERHPPRDTGTHGQEDR